MPKSKFKTKKCKTHGETEFVLEGRGYYRCKKCRSEAVTCRRKKTKKRLVDHFGGSCKVCGYSKYAGCLDFHHLDPTKKDFGIGSRGKTLSLTRLISEAEKCILVCNRCHGEIHGGLLKVSDYV